MPGEGAFAMVRTPSPVPTEAEASPSCVGCAWVCEITLPAVALTIGAAAASTSLVFDRKVVLIEVRGRRRQAFAAGLHQAGGGGGRRTSIDTFLWLNV